MMSRTEEDFELELRSLAGVLNVGMTHLDNGDIDEVTLVVNSKDPTVTQNVASQIASLYYPDAKVIVDGTSHLLSLQRRPGSRVAFVKADYDSKDGACEVQLTMEGRVGIGRAGSGPLIGGAEATLGALRDLGYDIPFSLLTVTNVTNGRDWPVVVTLRSNSGKGDRFGIAKADDDMVSAAKATLDALNRFISTSEPL